MLPLGPPSHSGADWRQGNYIFSHFYNLAIASTKLSVLALYHRIFATRTYRLLVWATATFVLLWLLTIEVVLGFACRPVQAFWGAAPGTCLDLVVFGYFTNITNLVADLWIFALPIPMLLGLQAKLSKKIGLCFLFSVGLGTCAISAARLTWVFSFGSPDITCESSRLWMPFVQVADPFCEGTQVSLGILSAWEPCGGILGGNLPIVYKTIKGIFPGKNASSAPSDQKTGSTQESLGPKKENVYYDWVRLDSSGGTAVAMDTVPPSQERRPDTPTPKRSAASMELELFEGHPALASPHAI